MGRLKRLIQACSILPGFPVNLRPLLALAAGASGVLAFSPFDLWPAAFLSFSALLLLTEGRCVKKNILNAFSWGLGFYSAGASWIYNSISVFGGMNMATNIVVMIMLISYLSLYPALFAYLLGFFSGRSSYIPFMLAAPAIWYFTEYLRGHAFTGFPWLQLGYSQTNGPLQGLAPVGGVELITFIMVMLSGGIAYAILHRNIKAICVVILAMMLPSAASIWTWTTPVKERNTPVALVQGNISPAAKWRASEFKSVLDTYISLTRKASGRNALIVWPETAIPARTGQVGPLLEELNSLMFSNNNVLITGIIDSAASVEGRKDFNAILALGNNPSFQPTPLHRYYKHHLVPFGEFTPLESLLKPLSLFFAFPESAFSRGSYIQPPLQAGDLVITPAICYEIVEGKQIRDNFRADSDAILTISDDAWFGHSIGPAQHFQMARMRAMELGRPLIRAANNGISAIVDGRGKVVSQLPQYQEGLLIGELTPETGLTPYARWSNGLVMALATLCFIASLIIRPGYARCIR